VAGDALLDPGQAGCLPDGFLQPALVQVMAAHDAAAGVRRQPLRRKDVLPGPLLVGVGVFALQGLGQVDCAIAPGQVVLVQQFHVLEMLLEWRDEAVGQHRYPVLQAHDVADDDGAAVELEVLDAQAQALHQPQAAAVEQFGHQPVHARRALDDARCLFPGQHGGQPFGLGGTQRAKRAIQVLAQHLAVQEQEGAEGLVLRRSGGVLVHGQVSEEGLDFRHSHFLRMAFAVEQDEAGGPAGVGLLGADGVVLEADGVTDTSTELSAGLVEEIPGALFHTCAPKCLTCRYFAVYYS